MDLRLSGCIKHMHKLWGTSQLHSSSLCPLDVEGAMLVIVFGVVRSVFACSLRFCCVVSFFRACSLIVFGVIVPFMLVLSLSTDTDDQ